jgi:hypothetical protein
MSYTKNLHTELTIAVEDYTAFILESLERGEFDRMLHDIDALRRTVEYYGKKSGAL